MRFGLPLFIPLFAALFVLPTPAFAIYKCINNADVMYSDTPCPGGSQLAIDTTAVSSFPKDKDAKEQLKKQKAESKQLEKERHKQTAKEENQQRQTNRAKAAKQKKCASLALTKKWAEEDALTTNSSSMQAAAKAKKKAHRAEEKYMLNCA